MPFKPLEPVPSLEKHDCHIWELTPDRALTTLGIINKLLPHYLSAQELNTNKVIYGKNGKPELQTDANLQFSVSHTDRHWFCIFSRDEVGLDAEKMTRECDAKAIARRYFSSDEQAYINAGKPEEPQQRFLEIWTAKEAYIKFKGSKLSQELSSTQVVIASNANEASIIKDGHKLSSPVVQYFNTGTHLLAIASPNRMHCQLIRTN